MNRSPRQRRLSSLLVLMFVALSASCVSAAIAPAERTALINLYTSTNGDSWTIHTGWNGAIGTECSWYGVICDASPSVIEVSLGGNNLTGSLPSDLSNLTRLVTFDVGHNQLAGSMPALSSLTSLSYFYVNDNQLTGSIPTLSGLTNLAVIDVGANHLTGSIPALSGLTNLFAFYAYDNQLTGSIPTLAGLTNLFAFEVERNQLTGAIPALTGLSNLFYISVESNQLTGNLPSMPSPSNFTAHNSVLCPNFLNHTVEPAWDAATGTTPWYADCLASEVSVDLHAGVARPGGLACVAASLDSRDHAVGATSNTLAFDGATFTFEPCTINAAIGAGSAANKSLDQSSVSAGNARLEVSGNLSNPIPDGGSYSCGVRAAAAALPGSYPISNFVAAQDTAGAALSASGSGAAILISNCQGDCNGDNSVSLGEVTKTVNLFLGAPLCDPSAPAASCSIADQNLDGVVTLGEVTQAVTSLLGVCPSPVPTPTPSITPTRTVTPTPTATFVSTATPSATATVDVTTCSGDTAVAADVLAGSTFSSSAGVGVIGTMPDVGQQIIAPGTTDQMIGAGHHDGSGYCAGDADLLAANIANAVEIFAVTGKLIAGGPLKTGQTQCASGVSGTGAMGGCPQTISGQDGETQKGTTRSFTVHTLTIMDNVTGLEWEKLCDDTTSTLCPTIHSMETSYRWLEARTKINTMNADNYAGHNDWRLPNRFELESLIDLGRPAPAINSVFHNAACTLPCDPILCSCTKSDSYWTSTSRPDLSSAAWYVNFVTGFVSAESKSNDNYARAVRGALSAPPASPLTMNAPSAQQAATSAPDVGTGSESYGTSGAMATCSSGTAVAADVLAGKTFSSSVGLGVTGTMTNVGQQSITPGTTAQMISAGYHDGTGYCAGDADLVAANIANGIGIFGVTGTLKAGTLLKTGQTTCASGAAGSSALNTCPQTITGQDGDSQTGLARSYKVTSRTIRDNVTGLEWEKLCNDSSPYASCPMIHSMGSTYTWLAARNKVTALNADNYAGSNDWRLPNLNELKSLVDLGRASPAIDPAFNSSCTLPCSATTCSCTNTADAGRYWSSTSSHNSPTAAWRVLFSNGGADAELKTNAFYVRAVRDICASCTCSDGIQNQAETGVDCGGPCAACPPSCSDAMQNQGEAGVDCGGPCVACPTCSDGIQNQGETAIDCAGPCPVCTCSDGIQNQGEVGIDCNNFGVGVCRRCAGQPCSAGDECHSLICSAGTGTCAESTCNDGVQNQLETAVDCGGPCAACPP